MIRSVCVYCSASNFLPEVYQDAARDLGAHIAQAGMKLVYGGGRNGLMGIVANAALSQGGEVLGFITNHLEDREGGHTGITELHIVDTMHTRKEKMVKNADAFVILPGGFGTCDELFEVMTWKQLLLHNKPIIMLNINDYWVHLIRHMHHTVDEGFAKPEHRNLVIFLNEVNQVAPTLKEFSQKLYFDNESL